MRTNPSIRLSFTNLTPPPGGLFYFRFAISYELTREPLCAAALDRYFEKNPFENENADKIGLPLILESIPFN